MRQIERRGVRVRELGDRFGVKGRERIVRLGFGEEMGGDGTLNGGEM